MLNKYEAQKLQFDMREELQATSAAILKCAAGLLAITAIALLAP